MKNKIISLIVVMLLLTLMVGVTYSFFNYTRTGSENRVSVGRISFTSSQDNTINLTNVFPARSDNLNNSNSDTVTVNITGDTTYTGGIEYKVTIEDINNTINDKEIPLSFKLTTSNLGEKSNEYWSDRGSTTNVYNLIETGVAEEGKYILVGYIKPDSVGVNGSIDITAYIDTEKIAISDTYSRIENNELIIGETTSEWADGRVVLTTDEWNSFTNSPISFKVKVEANEGTWVEEEKYVVLKNLYGITEWKDIRANITSIEFHKDGIVPENSIHTIDATDITSTGPVTVYTVDDGLGNNTYKAIVVANDTIYAPENSTGLFYNMMNLSIFNSENFKVDNVTNMLGMFQKCLSLSNIRELSNWNTENVTVMQAMFRDCISLSNISELSNWNIENVTDLSQLFYNCTSLSSVDDLLKWNTKSATTVEYMFYNCTNLINVNGLINWDTSGVTSMNSMFFRCNSLADITGLSNWNTKNVNDISNLFNRCTNLVNVDSLKKWDTTNVTLMSGVFFLCENLVNISGLINWNTSKVTTMEGIFGRCIDLIEFTALANWNTINVTNMYAMFAVDSNNLKTGNPVIDFSALTNWNVGNVINMEMMFLNINIKSYIPFRNWNVGKVENFSYTFNATIESSTVETLTGLENWDVSSATNMSYMFGDNASLIDASAINNWNINANIDFTKMFKKVSVHPEFTRVLGTWDSEGTFTPNI